MFNKRLILSVVFICCAISAQAQVKFDRTLHDFGDVTVADGPLVCTFTFTNQGKTDALVTSVVSSCGCTGVKWTRAVVHPGEKGSVTATYSNDEGPGSFDKVLTVYVKDAKKPQILHIRGIVNEKKLPLQEAYPVHFGPIGFKKPDYKGGNLRQGETCEGEFSIANISGKSINISFSGISEGLCIIPEKSRLGAGEKTTVRFTITADRSRWGKNWYYATPLADGKSFSSTGREAQIGPAIPGGEALRTDANAELAEGCSKIGIWAVTRDNFSSLNKEDLLDAPSIEFSNSTFEFGRIKAGTTIEARFPYTVSGKNPLCIHKIECDSKLVKIKQSKGLVTCTIDSSSLPKGDQLFVVSIYTNCPSKSVTSLFITGIVR